jgi:uncharacterized protein with HEPN domain
VKDDRLYLIHIRECIERIARYTVEGKSAFFTDTRTQDAVVPNLQTLSESTQRISSSLKTNHAEVDWRSIAAFRNVAVHDYLGIDLKQIWDIVERDLPDLKRKMETILRGLG